MDFLRFPFEFDVTRLRADLELIETNWKWHAHPDKYQVEHSGDWTAIALIASEKADPDDPESLRYRGQVSGPTPILTQCLYLPEVIGSFKTDVHRVRLMNLKPGKVITPHCDYGEQRYSLERGFIRVHVPIRTDPDVSFFINGLRLPMEEGEAWYTNVCKPHSVRNDSSVHRVHLVLDMQVNDWVRQYFPKQTLRQMAYGSLLRRCERPYTNIRFTVLQGWNATREKLGDWGLRKMKRTHLR
jgi:hypothetical protein